MTGPEALAALARDAANCIRCPLYRDATQTVFGEGAADAPLMLVGEQPGDQEDRKGHPFVGPAGGVLDRALEAAGIARDAVYVTNAVKHFKFEQRGKRRLHKGPNAGEIAACRWWLERELALVRPSLVVALGASAAHALLGRAVTISRTRGRVMEASGDVRLLVTTHPSAILRVPDAEARAKAFDALVADLVVAREAA